MKKLSAFLILVAILLLVLVGLKVHDFLVGYSSMTVYLSESLLESQYGVKSNVFEEGEYLTLSSIQDKSILFNKGESLKIGSMIYNDFYFVMEVTEEKKPITFNMDIKQLAFEEIVSVDETKVQIVYDSIVAVSEEPLTCLIKFSFTQNGWNYFGYLEPTFNSPLSQHYHIGTDPDPVDQEIVRSTILALIP